MSNKKLWRIRSRYTEFRFRDWKFMDGMLETTDEKVVEEFKKQPWFGPGGDAWLDDTAETEALVNASVEKSGGKKN